MSFSNPLKRTPSKAEPFEHLVSCHCGNVKFTYRDDITEYSKHCTHHSHSDLLKAYTGVQATSWQHVFTGAGTAAEEDLLQEPLPKACDYSPVPKDGVAPATEAASIHHELTGRHLRVSARDVNRRTIHEANDAEGTGRLTTQTEAKLAACKSYIDHESGSAMGPEIFFCGVCGATVALHLRFYDAEGPNAEQDARGQIFFAQGLIRDVGGEDTKAVGKPSRPDVTARHCEVLPRLVAQEPGKQAAEPPRGPEGRPTRNEITDHPVLQPPDVLPARCGCGSIRFHVTRPNDRSTVPHRAWPDLLVPFATNPAEVLSNPGNHKWWLRETQTEEDGKTPVVRKYLAGWCACESCRLTSGFELQAWAFVPWANLWTAAEGEVEDLSRFEQLDMDRLVGEGRLTRYEATEGKYREFCSRCGATCFWREKDDSGVVDVSVGLLRGGKEDSACKEWLAWCTERISFVEEIRISGEEAEMLINGA